MSQESYALAMKNLMYVIICTRLGIEQAVKAVSILMENPGREHWN